MDLSHNSFQEGVAFKVHSPKLYAQVIVKQEISQVAEARENFMSRKYPFFVGCSKDQTRWMWLV
jgi:hypothetical protein